MKKRDLLNIPALLISKYKIKKAFLLNDLDDLYEFAQNYVGKGHFDRLSLNQFKSEFLDFAKYIKQSNPKIVVEIGTKKGGSFFIWARYLKPSHLISIDLPGGIHGGGFNPKKIPFLKYLLSDHKNSKVSIILGDSHNKNTLDKLISVLNGSQIDFLFIDGDHTYEGVKSDFEMYKGLVKKGGLIGFHDIANTDYHHNLNCYVDVLWNQIKEDHEYVEFFENKNQRKYGIGVIKV